LIPHRKANANASMRKLVRCCVAASPISENDEEAAHLVLFTPSPEALLQGSRNIPVLSRGRSFRIVTSEPSKDEYLILYVSNFCADIFYRNNIEDTTRALDYIFCVHFLQCGRANRAKAIPKGAWRLQLLSDRPLLPLSQSPQEGGGSSDPSPSPASPRGGASGDPGEEEGGGSMTVVPCLERVVYGGDYVPNKYFRLFRWGNARIR